MEGRAQIGSSTSDLVVDLEQSTGRMLPPKRPQGPHGRHARSPTLRQRRQVALTAMGALALAPRPLASSLPSANRKKARTTSKKNVRNGPAGQAISQRQPWGRALLLLQCFQLRLNQPCVPPHHLLRIRGGRTACSRSRDSHFSARARKLSGRCLPQYCRAIGV